MDLKQEISSETEVEIKLNEEGQAVFVFNYGGKLGGVKLEASMDMVMLVDKITDLIPGETDDMILDNLAKKLLAKKSV